MKLLLSIILSMALLGCLQAQSLISTAGGYAEAGAYQLSWSIGEAITQSVSSSEYILTQGFHQSEAHIVPEPEPEPNPDVLQVSNALTLSVYPNPTQRFVTVNATGEDLPQLRYQLLYADGRVLHTGSLQRTSNRIDLGVLPPAVYLLQVSDNKNLLHSYRILKTE